MKHYLDALENARNAFVRTDSILPIIKPHIAESWKRCRYSGLDPDGIVKPETVTPDELKKTRTANKELINAAAPLIDKLFSITSFPLECIWLTDANCIILDKRGSAETLHGFQEKNICFGADLEETFAGTNPIDMAIRTDQPIQMIGGEHYFKGHTDSCGTAAPIHSISGDIIGALCISVPAKEISSFANLNMLKTIVSNGIYSIERQIEHTCLNKLNNTIFEMSSDGIMIVDEKQKIININNSGARILDVGETELTGKSLSSVLLQSPEHLQNSPVEQSYRSEMVFSINNKTIRCRGTAQSMPFCRSTMGMLITFTEEKSFISKTSKPPESRYSCTFDQIITQSPDMLAMLENARHIADTNLNVLILGESGTGKELLAQSIHNASSRSSKPMVVVNCAALPRELVESELFGYEKGAFTGALAEGQMGKFELANGGTLFLDEIGELPLEIQPKLLRAIEYHKITRIGGTQEKEIDVRLICATNRNLEQEIYNNNFRLDLYYRINVLTLKSISLDERKEDIPLLVEHFLTKLNNETGMGKSFSQGFIQQLMDISWPGNIRQLENAFTQSYYLCNDDIIRKVPCHVYNDKHEYTEDKQSENTSHAASPSTSGSPAGSIEHAEYQAILNALQRNNGSITRSLSELNIGRTTLYRKMKHYGIDRKKFVCS